MIWLAVWSFWFLGLIAASASHGNIGFRASERTAKPGRRTRVRIRTNRLATHRGAVVGWRPN